MEEVYSMSDKMLMEGWRKFLVEQPRYMDDADLDGDGIPDSQQRDREAEMQRNARLRRASKVPPSAGIVQQRALLVQKIQKLKQTYEGMETESDSLILKLERIPFWDEVFAVKFFDYRKQQIEDKKEDQELKKEGFAKALRKWKADKDADAPPPKDKDRTTIDAIVKYYFSEEASENRRLQGGDEAEWVKVAEFVGSCYLTNIDEGFHEFLENYIAAPIGETSKTTSLRAKIVGGGAMTAAGALAQQAALWAMKKAAYTGEPGTIASAGFVGGAIGGAAGLLLGPLLSKLESSVKKDDFEAFMLPAVMSLDLDKGIERPLEMAFKDLGKTFDEALSDSVILAFHRLENQILLQLNADPLTLPTFTLENISKEFSKDYDYIRHSGEIAFKDAVKPGSWRAEYAQEAEEEPPVEESKFHDDWRNFLLTEEKK
jgi:hypothetical protein